MERAHTLSIDLNNMASDPGRVMRFQTNPSFLTTFNHQGRKLQEPIDISDDNLWSEHKGSPSIPENTTTFAPDPLSQFLNHPRHRAQIKGIAQEEARQNYAHEMEISLLNAAEEALTDAFQTGFKSANKALKECTLPISGKWHKRLITQTGTGRHSRTKHRKLGSFLFFYEGILLRTTKIFSLCTTSCKIHP